MRDNLAGRHVIIKGAQELRRDQLSEAFIGRYTKRLKRTPSGCYLWTGAVNADGYGIVRLNRKRLVLAHRVAIAIVLKVCPANKVADHMCGIRGCCAPDHLRLASIEENSPGIYGGATVAV